MQPASGPGPGDQVSDEDGARVFVGPGVAEVLAGMPLDTVMTTEDQVRYNIAPQS